MCKDNLITKLIVFEPLTVDICEIYSCSFPLTNQWYPLKQEASGLQLHEMLRRMSQSSEPHWRRWLWTRQLPCWLPAVSKPGAVWPAVAAGVVGGDAAAEAEK